MASEPGGVASSGLDDENLFGDVASELPSPSLASTWHLQGNQVDQVQDAKQGQPSSHVNFEHVVGAAWNSLTADTVEPIWNTGFWKCIFGSDVLQPNLENTFKRPVPVDETAVDDNAGDDACKKQCLAKVGISKEPLFKTCVKSTDDVHWQEQREAHLQRALKHWLVIVTSWSSNVEFVQCLAGCDSVNAQLIMLGDVFRGKAPSTLTKRANSMRLLCEKLEQVGLEFPCNEPSLYGVICKLRRLGAPVSRSKGILESIAFVRYTMGVLECDALLKGRRCWGASTSDEPLHRNQASPLSVEELRKLHEVLEHGQDAWNRMFAGATLFVVYARARWSDAQHSSKLSFDKDGEKVCFVEAVTGLHKTVRALQHRHQFLPLAAPSTGVTDSNWGELWETVRSELGINFEAGHPLMPAPLESGAPGKRALDSQEAGRWLRALLELDESALQGRKVSSHSMKSTMLSFLAKRGVDMPDRLLLGYHTSPFTMGLTYSRDGMARPLQILMNMLEEIRKGLFLPDCTRSGRLVQPEGKKVTVHGPELNQDVVKVEISDDEGDFNVWDLIPESHNQQKPLVLPDSIPETCEEEVNDACTETSSSDMSEPENGGSTFEDSGRRTFAPPTAPAGFTMWQHTKSKILHLCDYKTPNVFECGRKPGAFHTCNDLRPRWDSGICWKCFKNR